MSVSLPERFNGEAYRGINILMLWAIAMDKDYSSARWMTFNQAKQFFVSVPEPKRRWFIWLLSIRSKSARYR